MRKHVKFLTMILAVILMLQVAPMAAFSDSTDVGALVDDGQETTNDTGTEPDAPCDRHLAVSYDKITGGVCTLECPGENVITVGLIHVQRSFPMELYVTDAQYTFRDIGLDILPETSPMLPFYNNLSKENEYFGISKTAIQYNRACREHFNYFEWKKRQEENVG